MEKQQLGTTDLFISPVGMGVGGILGMKMFNEQQALNVIQRAIDEGINFFDTGSAYSYGNAEVRLGKVLNKNTVDKLVIATKAGTIIQNNKFTKDFSPASLRQSLETSLRKLHVEKINLFQLHSPSIHHLTDEVIKTLQTFKAEGKIDYLGVSCDGKVLNHVLETEFFDSVMLTYNILNQSAAPQIEKAKQKGVGVLIKSPMAHALYSNNIFKIKGISDLWYLLRVLKNYRPELFKGFKYRFINKYPNWQGAEIALRFVLENPNVDCALIGTTKLSHLEANIRVASRELPDSIMKEINELSNA